MISSMMDKGKIWLGNPETAVIFFLIIFVLGGNEGIMRKGILWIIWN